MNNIINSRRKSSMTYGEIYFWTATINQWFPLLSDNRLKDIIVDCLRFLSAKNLLDLFAFVIMPTHLHFIWRPNAPNGKESPTGSFLKHTAHAFKKLLIATAPDELAKFRVEASNKNYELWQRDPLATPLYSKEVALQKLKYIHNNPLAERWQLVKHPSDYKYSSALYYEEDKRNWEFLKDLYVEF